MKKQDEWIETSSDGALEDDLPPLTDADAPEEYDALLDYETRGFERGYDDGYRDALIDAEEQRRTAQ